MTQIGKYEVVKRLASGGMAEVFLATATGPHGFRRRCVLKRILPDLAADASFVEMFLSEARIAGQLSHANLAQVYEVGEADGSYFLAMEYVDGPDLRALSRQARQRGVAVDPFLAAKIVSSACEGLAYAHALSDPDTGERLNIVHRDISPDNIILTRAGGVKVVDFGIAKATTQLHQTRTGVVKGKPAYMAPEQMERKAVDQRADVFSLGVVLYELLCGARPYDARDDIELIHAIILKEPTVPLQQRRWDTPDELARIVDRATAREVADRYPDCAAFQADLERFIHRAPEPIGAGQIAQLIEQVGAKGSWSQDGSGTPAKATPVSEPAASPKATAEVAPPADRTVSMGKVPVPPPPEPAPDARTVSFPDPMEAAAPSTARVTPRRPDPPVEAPAPDGSPERMAVLPLVAAGAVMIVAGVAVALWVTRGDTVRPPAPKAPVVAEVVRPPVETPPAQVPPAPPPTPAQAAATVDDTGTLVVRVMPYAAVYVDGKYVRDVQGRGSLKLSAGAHRVMLQHPRGKAEFSVTIAAGQERRVEKSFLGP